MKRRSLLAAIALAVLLSGGPAFAATFHAIIFANTEDEGIGCIYDVVNMGGFLRDAQKETGMNLKAKVFLDVAAASPEKVDAIRNWAEVVNGWSKAHLEKEIKSLSPGKDDIVLFYYSGHGGRMSNKKGRWPDMALQGHDLVDLQYPIDLLAKKGVQPRLALALGDCCNSFMDRSAAPATRSAKAAGGLRNLFLNYAGNFIASGSEPGQYSLGGSDGGVFTNCWLKAAYNPANPDWGSVLQSAQTMAARNTEGEQKPQYDVKGLRPAGTAGPVASATVAAAAVETAPGWGSAAGSAAAAATGTGAASAETAPGWGSAAGSAAGSVAAPAPETAPGWGSAAGSATTAGAASAETDGEASFAYTLPIVDGQARGSRNPGNSPYPFAELTEVSLKDEDGDLVATFGLKGLQKNLVFNSPKVPDDYMEYEWAAALDVDGDGTNDYSLSLSHFKPAGSEKKELSVSRGCQADLWALEGNGASSVDIDIVARIDKNSIILTVPSYRDEFEFRKGASVSFSALYYLGGESYIP